jgi:diguanylate cyclase (GGDEF)-like protein
MFFCNTFSLTVYQFRLFGISSILLDVPTDLAPLITWILLAATTLGACVFSRKFLNTKVNTPILDKFLLLLILLAPTLAILGITGQHRLANFIGHLTGLLGPMAFLVAGSVCLYKGIKSARYYVISWFILLLSIILFSMGGTIIPSTYLTFHAVLLGSVLEAILLSFALADRISVFKVEQKKSIHRERRLTRISLTDPLTGLYNRRYLMDRLTDEVNKAHRLDLSLCLIMIDVDNFKNYNDTFGHPEGDKVLIKLAEVIRSSIRDEDGPCRYGGEEFIIVLPHSDTESVFYVAERIRRLFSDEPFRPAKSRKITVTISLGLTQLRFHEDVKTFMVRVDDALYQAKAERKNRVKVL